MIIKYNDLMKEKKKFRKEKIKIFFRKLSGYLGLGFCPTCGGGEFITHGYYEEKSYCKHCKESNENQQ
jgi:uncharacterized protein (DUF983 family)